MNEQFKKAILLAFSAGYIVCQEGGSPNNIPEVAKVACEKLIREGVINSNG